MAYEGILRAGQAVQATALLADTVGFARKRKRKVKDFLTHGTRQLVGTSLLRAQAQLL